MNQNNRGEECDWCEGLGTRTISVEQDNGYGEIQQEECGKCRGTGTLSTPTETDMLTTCKAHVNTLHETDIANELACVLTNNEQGSFQKNLETAKEYLEAYSKILLTNQHTEHAKELEELAKACLKVVEEVNNYDNPKTANDCADEIKAIAISKNIKI